MYPISTKSLSHFAQKSYINHHRKLELNFYLQVPEECQPGASQKRASWHKLSATSDSTERVTVMPAWMYCMWDRCVCGCVSECVATSLSSLCLYDTPCTIPSSDRDQPQQLVGWKGWKGWNFGWGMDLFSPFHKFSLLHAIKTSVSFCRCRSAPLLVALLS